MKKIFLLTAILTIFLCSCTDKTITAALEMAETIVSDNPDSALSILNSLQKDEIVSRKNNARFSLLYSMATEKKHIFESDDSIIKDAVAYYKDHGTDEEKAKSYYYLGRVRQNAGQHIQAMVTLTLAEKHASLCGNNFYLGLIHRTMGDSYVATYSNSEALKCYNQASSDFAKADAQKHKDYLYLDIALAYNNIQLYEECAEACRKGIEIAKELRDTAYFAECLRIYANAALYSNESPDLGTVIGTLRYIQDSLKCSLTYKDYTVLANAYTKKGNTEAAEAIVNQIKTLVPKHSDTGSKIEYSEYLIAATRNSPEEALYHYEKVIEYHDSVANEVMRHSLLSTQREMLQQQNENDRMRIQSRNRMILLVILFFVIFISILCYTFYRRLQLNKRESSEYVNRINEAVEQIREAGIILKEKNAKIEELGEGMQKLFGVRLSHLDNLCQEYYSFGHTSARYKRIFHQAKALIDSLSEDQEYGIVESMTNAAKDNIMSKIRREFPNFRESDFRLLCYLYAGFSASTVSLLTHEEKVDNIYSRKSRLKKRIENSESPMKEFFLKNLK